MATVVLTPEDASAAGLEPDRTTVLSAADTYHVDNHRPFVLHFLKDAAVDCDVTFAAPAVDGIRGATSEVVSVPATTGDVVIGPFDPNDYNDVSDVVFTVSDVDGLTVAVIALPLTHRKA